MTGIPEGEVDHQIDAGVQGQEKEDDVLIPGLLLVLVRPEAEGKANRAAVLYIRWALHHEHSYTRSRSPSRSRYHSDSRDRR